MRLGGPIPEAEQATPAAWIAALKERGYRAAYCPVAPGASAADIEAFRRAAEDEDVVIAEVGAWSNPLGPDPQARAEAREKCVRSLELAEAIGARCCVNVVGSLGERWDGPDPRDLTDEAKAAIVESVRSFIDAVQPERTVWAMEMMPFMLPDTPETYLELIEAVDRPQVGVHFDPVNIINSPRRYWASGAVIDDCVARLGPRIVSCHAKDILLRPELTVHLDECRPGTGGLDYPAFLRAVDGLGDLPLMLEHLDGQEEYAMAAQHVRGVARELGIEL